MKNETEILKYYSKVSTGILLMVFLEQESNLFQTNARLNNSVVRQQKQKQLLEHFIVTPHHEIILTTICPIERLYHAK